MIFDIHTLDDVEVAGKTVLCRVDINEPVDRETGRLLDTARLPACVPTIRELSDKGAKVVILAHQGSDANYENYFTTAPHAEALGTELEREVRFIDDVCGPAARAAIRGLAAGEILLLDNVRFMAEETPSFEHALRLSHEQQADTLLVRKLAPLADLYVCDAFAAAHRSQPSLCGFEQLLTSAMGRLFEKEITTLSRLLEHPERPCVFVLGGAKLHYALQMMDTALSGGIADRVLAGGLFAQLLLWADGYEIGSPSRELIRKQDHKYLIEEAGKLLDRHRGRIVLPTDYGYVKNGRRREAMLHALPRGTLVSDIGAGTAELFRNIILEAKTVFVNGPMGVFEQKASALGTQTVWDALGETEGYTVIGGRDTIAATRQYQKTDMLDFISTGNMSLIRLLSGEELPVIKALRYGSKTTGLG